MRSGYGCNGRILKAMKKPIVAQTAGGFPFAPVAYGPGVVDEDGILLMGEVSDLE
jgi:hypothetical protein